MKISGSTFLVTGGAWQRVWWAPSFAPRWRLVVGVVLAAAAVWWVVSE